MNDSLRIGPGETNPISESGSFVGTISNPGQLTPLSDPNLVKILRVRLIGYSRDCPFWDISYVVGELRDGDRVYVDLEIDRLGRSYKADLIKAAKRAGRFGKGMGLLDDNVISTLRG